MGCAACKKKRQKAGVKTTTKKPTNTTTVKVSFEGKDYDVKMPS